MKFRLILGSFKRIGLVPVRLLPDTYEGLTEISIGHTDLMRKVSGIDVDLNEGNCNRDVFCKILKSINHMSLVLTERPNTPSKIA